MQLGGKTVAPVARSVIPSYLSVKKCVNQLNLNAEIVRFN